MAETVPVTSRQETPVFFPSGEETLFGILTHPTASRRGVAVVLAYGGGHKLSSIEGELFTRMARQLAGNGYHVLRYDHHGNGDSTGSAGVFDHRFPFSDDLTAAVEWMQTQGFKRFVLIGQCLGARAALKTAQKIDSVEAVGLLSAIVHDARMGKDEEWALTYGMGHYVKRAFQWKAIRRLSDPELRRAYGRVAATKIRHVLRLPGSPKLESARAMKVSPGFLEPLRDIVGRGVPVHLVFGGTDTPRLEEWEEAKAGALGPVLDDAGDRIEVTVVDGRLADCTDASGQDGSIDVMTRWLSEEKAPV